MKRKESSGLGRGPKKGKKTVPRKASQAVSITYFKDNVDPKNYKFENWRSWTYCDRVDKKVVNEIQPIESNYPHLVLRDSSGRPRAVLQYTKVHSGGV